MAMYCISGVGECDGCGACREERNMLYDEYDDPIYEGEDYYKIGNDIISEGNIWEYLKEHKETRRAD